MTTTAALLAIIGALLVSAGAVMTFLGRGAAPWWLLIVFGVLMLAAAALNAVVFG